MKSCILRGVPPSLQQDGWWLDPITRITPSSSRPHAAQNPRRYALHALLLAGLIGAALVHGQAQTSTPGPLACGTENDLGFHAARGLRSLEATRQQGTPL